jgi:hypothetical protein
MNKKNQELAKLTDQLKEKLRHYELRHASTVGKDVYVFKVNEVYAVRNVDGKTQLCRGVEASLFTAKVIDDILGGAKFSDRDGKPLNAVGGVLAETYFAGLISDAKDTITIMEQTLESLKDEEGE